jgi:AraC family transcriptional regulator, positive regulator of tynA and feaB
MMRQRELFLSSPDLDYDAWQAVVRSICGRYRPSGIEPQAFSGGVSTRSIFGLIAVDFSCNACCLERTLHDIRDDAKDHYCALFQITGQSKVIQNDQAMQLTVDDFVLLDAARPVMLVPDAQEAGSARWDTLQLPRRSLVSYLGLEPECPSRRRGAPAARALRQLLQESRDAPSSFASDDVYMRLAVYDLLAALFAPVNHINIAASSQANQLFAHICNIIMANFSDPEFNPHKVAAEAGISLRYLQKLFFERHSNCSRFICSVRLDHAASLLRRRSFLRTTQPISTIAYASGFAHYLFFYRQFRLRYGHTPSSYSEKLAEHFRHR